jgi:hypothetical protein
MYCAYTHKLTVVAIAVAVGLLAAIGLLLGMARSAAVTTATIAAAPVLGGWLVIAAPPSKRVAHGLGLTAFGLMVWLGVYVLPVGLTIRVMLGYLA